MGMMKIITSTLLSLSFVLGLAACGGPADDLEGSAAEARASASRKDRTCGGDNGNADSAEAAPSRDIAPGGGGGGSLAVTCWCDTSQGTGDGTGCPYAIGNGGSCSAGGECHCGDEICGEIQNY
jgi:hypothetical protein